VRSEEDEAAAEIESRVPVGPDEGPNGVGASQRCGEATLRRRLLAAKVETDAVAPSRSSWREELPPPPPERSNSTPPPLPPVVGPLVRFAVARSSVSSFSMAPATVSTASVSVGAVSVLAIAGSVADACTDVLGAVLSEEEPCPPKPPSLSPSEAAVAAVTSKSSQDTAGGAK
jgi:hypothetical protein